MIATEFNSIVPEWYGSPAPADRMTIARPRPQQHIAQDLPAWATAAARQLYELGQLELGWDGHSGRPIKRELLQFAVDLLRDVLLPDTPPPSIVPLASGAIQLEWHEREMDIEVRVRDVMAAEVFVEDGQKGESFEFEQRIDFASLEAVIREFTSR